MAKSDDMRKALKAAAEDDKDKDCQARARKALAAFESDDKDKSDDKEKDRSKAADDAPEKKDDDKDKAKAESDDKSKAEDKKEDKAESSAETDALAALSAQLAQAKAAIAELTARNAESDLAAFKATRPDIKGEQWAALAALPLPTIKAVIAATPVAAVVTVAQAERTPAQGQTAGMSADVASMNPAHARAMGLLPPEPIQGDSAVHYVGVTPAPKAS